MERLKTRHLSYASFRLTADASHREALLCIDAWDEGTLVKNFYVQRQHMRTGNTRDAGSSHAGDGSQMGDSSSTGLAESNSVSNIDSELVNGQNNEVYTSLIAPVSHESQIRDGGSD